MLQGRDPATGKWTSPSRDITYLFPGLCKAACIEFDHLREDITELMDKFGVTLEELTLVARDVARFINDVHKVEETPSTPDGTCNEFANMILDFSPETSLEAKAVFASLFLRHASFQFAVGVRSVTHPDENDAPDFSDIIAKLQRPIRPTLLSKLKAIWRVIKL